MDKKIKNRIKNIGLWILIAACFAAAVFFAWQSYHKDEGVGAAHAMADADIAAWSADSQKGKDNAAGAAHATADADIAAWSADSLTIKKVAGAQAVADKKETAVSSGRLYIKTAESLNPQPIENKLFELERKRLLAELEKDPGRLFETLKGYNTVIIGDSRAVGFSYYNYLDAAHVLSGVSWSIMQIPSVYPQVAAINPQVIIISFGINELGPVDGLGYYYPTPEIYANATLNYINKLRELAPNAKIYFSGILPVQDWVLAKSPRYGRIPEWNEIMKPIFAEAKVGFIDVGELCANHQNLYIGDGVHFQGAFYPYWGAAILQAVLEDEEG